MALSVSTVWEVRTTGSDNSGGGFVAGASGTDYSVQDAAQFSGTDLVVDGTTNTKVTSATHNFVATDVGNLIQITAGAGWTTGFYQIVSVAANAATLDRSPAATSTTGGTWAEGGGLATIGKAITPFVAGNKVFVKSGTYTITATITLSVSATPQPATLANRLIGYGTTRGDAGRPTIVLSTNTGLTGLNVTGSGWWIENFIVNGSSLGTSQGITLAQYGCANNCKVLNCTSAGITLNAADTTVDNCEVTGCSDGTNGAIKMLGAPCNVTRCYVHDNTCSGIVSAASTSKGTISRCVVTNNTGATSDGIRYSYSTHIQHCVCYGNGRDGARALEVYAIGILIRANIFANNTGVGLTGIASTGWPATPYFDGNAYWNNTGGARANIDNATGINAVGTYTNAFDVTLTGNPFTNAAAGDFSLNNTAGAGAACRGAGIPGVFPGGLTTGYPDMGAAQHQDAGGAGGGLLVPNFTGGFGS